MNLILQYFSYAEYPKKYAAIYY